MGRQERTARTTKKAVAQAEAIISAPTEAGYVAKRCPVCKASGSIAELRASGHGKNCTAEPPVTKVTTTKRVVREPVDEQQALQGEKCEQMRNEGASWMAIGKALGLPGAKFGAAAARKLYAQHTGESHQKAPGLARKVSSRHAATVGAKRDRRAQVHFGTGLIDEEQTDEQVLELLRGKTIVWSIDLKRLADGKGEPEWCDVEAKVHPDFIRVELVGPLHNRCVRFRELLGMDDGKPISGPTRTVRLAAIHTVR